MKRLLILALLLPLCLSGCQAVPLPGGGGKTAFLCFSSFDGGGPEYACALADPELAAVESQRAYKKADHGELEGAGYTVTFTFKGKKEGETVLTVSSDSPLEGRTETRYTLTVDRGLNVTLEKLPEASETLPAGKSVSLVMETGKGVFYASLADTPAGKALTERLNPGAVELNFERSGQELRAALPWEIPEDGETVSARPGLLILQSGGEIVLCGASGAGEGRMLADFGPPPPSLFEDETLPACIWLEWSE